MSTPLNTRSWFWLVLVSTGFVAGYLAFDDSGELRRLRTQLTEAEATSERSRQPPSRPAVRRSAPRVFERTPATMAGVPANSMFEGITEQDTEIALEMNERSKNGEYILQFERPTDRKIMEAAVKAFAARMASNNAPELRQMFVELGISPEKAPLLETHAHKIMTASLGAEQAIQQVLLARTEYDRRIRALLNDDDYAKYRHFEESKHAVREHDLLTAYATQSGVTLDPGYQQQIVGLIKQAQAYTELTWHGPYDGLPQVATGNEMVIRQLAHQTDQLSDAANFLKTQASETGLPEAYVNLLDAYYGQRIQAKKDTINRIRNPSSPPRRLGQPGP